MWEDGGGVRNVAMSGRRSIRIGDRRGVLILEGVGEYVGVRAGEVRFVDGE